MDTKKPVTKGTVSERDMIDPFLKHNEDWLKKEEFNLSEVLWFRGRYIEAKDVKEFIKRLKEYLRVCPLITRNQFSEEIDKLAGDDLK